MRAMDLTSLPLGLLLTFGALAIVQLTLMAVALISLIRRTQEQVSFNKWVWAALIVFINMIGPILYFAIGRVRSHPEVAPTALVQRSSQEIADELYGAAVTDPVDLPRSAPRHGAPSEEGHL